MSSTYTVVIETAEAHTAENANEITSALDVYAPVSLGSEGTNLTVVLAVGASSLAGAVTIAVEAVEGVAKMQVIAVEATLAGLGTLRRAEEV